MLEYFQFTKGWLWYSQISNTSHFLLENLWISESSVGVLEKFPHSLFFSDIKYNCAVSFWSHLFIYASKYIFPGKNFFS